MNNLLNITEFGTWAIIKVRDYYMVAKDQKVLAKRDRPVAFSTAEHARTFCSSLDRVLAGVAHIEIYYYDMATVITQVLADQQTGAMYTTVLRATDTTTTAPSPTPEPLIPSAVVTAEPETTLSTFPPLLEPMEETDSALFANDNVVSFAAPAGSLASITAQRNKDK